MASTNTPHPDRQKQIDSAQQAAEHNKGHTILLVQFALDDKTRTFLDFEDISKLVDGICQMYEQKLKVDHPDKQDVTYDVSQLFNYLDDLKDLGALVYNVNIKAYEPKGRDWVKLQVYNGLKHQAS